MRTSMSMGVDNDLGVEVVVFVTDEIANPAHARPVDLRRQALGDRRIEFVQPYRSLADDKQLALDAAANKNVAHGEFSAASLT